MKIHYINSNSSDPFFNLALEDFILRSPHIVEENSEEDLFILLYRNDPALIIGNFQCLWKEVPWMARAEEVLHGMKIVRRQSGGGTVYHDRGNINFSLIFPKSLGEKNYFKKIWFEYFSSLGLVVESSGRDDFGIQKSINGKKVFYKFSGQAFKQTKDRNLHHGTLLFDSNLETLEKLCFPNKMVVSKSVDSVVSKVLNLSDELKRLNSLEEFLTDIISFFQNNLKAKHIEFERLHAIQDIHDKAKELSSWDHVYGRTPKFEFPYVATIDSIKYDFLFKIEKALVQDILSSDAGAASQIDFLKGVSLKQSDFLECLDQNVEKLSPLPEIIFTDLKDQLFNS